MTSKMALTVFRALQSLNFQIVARRVEETWQEPTCCCRVVSAAGYEYEVQASKGAKEQWEKLDMRVAYETDLVRGVVRKYTASDRTGICSGVCVKLQYNFAEDGALARVF